MMNVLFLMIGGALGALSRYGVSLLAIRWWGEAFPYGTLLVNLAGCLLIGFLAGVGEKTELITPQLRLLLLTGFLGSLTTFSSYALESVLAAEEGLYRAAITNFLVNNAGGFLLVFAGLRIARLLTR